MSGERHKWREIACHERGLIPTEMSRPVAATGAGQIQAIRKKKKEVSAKIAGDNASSQYEGNSVAVDIDFSLIRGGGGKGRRFVGCPNCGRSVAVSKPIFATNILFCSIFKTYKIDARLQRSKPESCAVFLSSS